MTVLEAIAAGNHHIELIEYATGLPRSVVTARLSVLHLEGLIRADHSQTFSQYHLTKTGEAACQT